ncbi:hypothetical protein [Flagellimonas sp.]|uniref:hypothetical protein n=1 Tax=Flagellimonas sp. TaxID=2058762 RepID=UPI003AB203A5
MKNTILTITIFYVSLFVGRGQTLNIESPHVIPPPPEASALFKSTEIPVNLSTGVPNISIPIYEIRLSDFALPISLNYNSSGIRVDEMASSVGLGWALQAGGMISSSVFGSPDFDTNGYMIPGTPFGVQDRELDPIQYYSGSQWIRNDDYEHCFEVTGSSLVFGSGSPTVDAIYDTQPDIYYYNFAGSSGKFFFSRDGKANTIPFRPILIERDGFTGFSIKDENGILYIYEAAERTLTSTVTYTAQSDFAGGISNTENYGYYLTRIETPKGEYIDLSYSDISYVYDLPHSYTRYRATGNGTAGMSQDAEVRIETATTVYGKRLNSITSSRSHRVDFVYENCARLDLPGRPSPGALTGSYALNQIQVHYGTTHNSFTLEHGYFNLSSYQPCVTTVSDPDNHRLKLLSIQKDGEPPYEFEYFGNNALPNRMAESKDHWGYYKSGGGRYPLEPQNGFYTGGNRSPNLNNTKQGVLTKMTYPTGGHSLFDYELNMARDTLSIPGSSQTRYVDIYYDEFQPIQEIDFTITPQVQPNSIQVSYMTTGTPVQANLQFNVTLYGPNSYYRVFQSEEVVVIDQIYLDQGQYTLRVEQVGAFEEGFFSMTYVEDNVTPPTTEITNVEVGGLRIRKIQDFAKAMDITPAKERVFSYTNPENSLVSSGRIANKPEYSYLYTKYIREYVSTNSTFMDRAGVFWAQNSTSIQPLSGLQGYHVQYINVRVANEELATKGYTDFKYSFVNDLVSYITYPATMPTSYDWKRGLLMEESVYKYDAVTSLFKPVRKVNNTYKFYYTPPDYIQNYSESGAHLTPPTEPNETHVVAHIIKLRYPEARLSLNARYNAEFDITSYKLISSWYHLEETTEQIFDNNGANPVVKTTNFFYDNPVHAQLTGTEVQTSTGNILQELTYYPDDVISVSSLGSPNLTNAQKLQVDKLKQDVLHQIARPVQVETINNGSKTVQRTNFAERNGIMLSDTIKTKKGSGVMESRLVFHAHDSNGNPLEVSMPGGPRTSYIWGYDRQYPVAKIENATRAQVETALGVSPGYHTGSGGLGLAQGNTLRAGLPDSMVTTYTYDPLVGVTSVTDPKGTVTYYGYDAYKRLEFVKDDDGHLVQEYKYNYKN